MAADPRPRAPARRLPRGLTVLRHQLPVHSPLSFGALVSAVAGSRHDRVLSDAGRLLCHRYAAESAILCGSGTQALQIALSLAARGRSTPGPVAVPAFTCYDVATAAVAHGAPVVLYDIDPDTLTPRSDSLERALRAGARTVVVAPLYGLPPDWSALEALAERYDALLIEDAAQGHGAAWQCAPLGALGRISVLSFGRGKGLTSGAGGAVLMRRGALAEGAAALVSTAPSADAARTLVSVFLAWSLGRPALYGLPRSIPWLRLGETVYHEPVTPHSMNRLAGSLLMQSMTNDTGHAAARRRNAEYYRTALADLPGVTMAAVHPSATPGYLRFPVRVCDAALAQQRSAARLGIAPAYPMPLAELPALRPLLINAHAQAGAGELARHLITLPTHGLLTPRDRRRIVDFVRAAAAPRSPVSVIMAGAEGDAQ